MPRAVSCISASCSDLPTSTPCAARKVLAIAPPITSTSTRPTRLPSSSSLVDTLAPPTIAADGPLGRAERRVQRLELRLHQPPGIGGQQLRHALGAGMRAMRGGEGVVRHRSRRAARAPRAIAGSFFSSRAMVARVLQHAARRRHSARITACWADDADAILGEAHAPPEHLAERRRHRRERHLRHAPALRPVEMAAHDHLRARAPTIRGWSGRAARCASGR